MIFFNFSLPINQVAVFYEYWLIFLHKSNKIPQTFIIT